MVWNDVKGFFCESSWAGSENFNQVERNVLNNFILSPNLTLRDLCRVNKQEINFIWMNCH